MHLLILLAFVFVVFAEEDDASRNRKAHEHDNEVHFGRGTILVLFAVLLILLILLDAVKGDDCALHSSSLTVLVVVLVHDFILLIRQSHLFALFGSLLQLRTNHFEQLVGVLVVALEFLTVYSDTGVQDHAKLLSLDVVSVKEDFGSRVIVSLILERCNRSMLLARAFLKFIQVVL